MDEAKTCKQCQSAFKVEKDDLEFLDQISPIIDNEKLVIPSPTLCPECRQKRRMSYRNERNLYLRKCDVTGKQIFSIFSPDSPHKVCDKDVWWSDQFDPMQYGRDYDENKSFFQQFHEFSLEIPLASLRVEKSENSDFNNDIGDCKDCYLCARTHSCQNCHYTYRGNHSKDCVDCMQAVDSEYLYECIECVNCNSCNYLEFCSNCSGSSFLFDCRGCNDCFLCTNLRSKQYCFMNQQLSREDYESKMAGFDFGSYDLALQAVKQFEQIKKEAIYKNLAIVNSQDCSGDNIVDSKNCQSCFGLKFSENSKYLWDVMKYKNSIDAYSGGRDSELIYETTAVANSYDCHFCLRATESRNVNYSYFIRSSRNIFGCIGLDHKEFCILNKQYSEDEYNRLLKKIIKKMIDDGEYGEFFPISNSLFAYNETVANDFFPMNKDEVLNSGFRWLEADLKEYLPATAQIPTNIKDANESILQDILSCECEECKNHQGKKCGKNYKINPLELSFYLEQKLPIPHKCPDCRFKARQRCKNPMKLRSTTCLKCSKNIDTTISEKKNLKIYCADCYEKEIY